MKKTWKGFILWVNSSLSEDDVYVVSQTFMVDGGREDGRHVRVEMSTEEAYRLATQLTRAADMAERRDRERRNR